MGFAKKKFSAWTFALTLVAGPVGTACAAQAAGGGATPPAGAAHAEPGYFAQHFSADALNGAVKEAVIGAKLAPVSFNKIIVHTRDQVANAPAPSGQGAQSGPATYMVTVVLENAGQGLIRRMQSVRQGDSDLFVRFDLTYRGYFPFITQTIPANANALPPAIDARKLLRFDTHTDGHMSFAYLYGANGQAAFADPGQVICDAGTRYSAAQIYAAMQGQARELNCQAVDSNGIVTDKLKLAYLEQYGVALVLHTQNPENSLDSTVVDFTVE